jgi:L-asparaginase
MLQGEDFRDQLPRNTIQLQFEVFSNLPSSHLTPHQLLNLAQRVNSLFATDETDGIVITHGTDTLEETAFLLDLTVNTVRPLVLTGAMRTATTVGYDGIANLAAAIRVAATPQAATAGALVVFNESIFAARSVQKTHCQNLDAFSAPGSGPIGRVEGEHVWLQYLPTNRQFVNCQRIEERVDLIRATQGADDRQLRHALADKVAGVVIETFGSGRVPPWWLPAISELIQHRCAVVITTRCGAGSLHDDYGYVGAYHDLVRLGAIFAHNLNGPKARIKLMVALGTARRPSELRGWFAA